MGRKGSAYVELHFERSTHNNKRVAVCEYCRKTLTNTGYNRLKAHRINCKISSTKMEPLPRKSEVDDFVEIKPDIFDLTEMETIENNRQLSDQESNMCIMESNPLCDVDCNESLVNNQLSDDGSNITTLNPNMIFLQNIKEEVHATHTTNYNNDEIFLKSMLGLMQDLPIDVKDDFQAFMYQKIYKLRAIARRRNITQ